LFKRVTEAFAEVEVKVNIKVQISGMSYRINKLYLL